MLLAQTVKRRTSRRSSELVDLRIDNIPAKRLFTVDIPVKRNAQKITNTQKGVWRSVGKSVYMHNAVNLALYLVRPAKNHAPGQ